MVFWNFRGPAMIPHDTIYKLQQGETQGIDSFMEELFWTYFNAFINLKFRWNITDLLYHFATGLKDPRLSAFAVRWIRQHRNNFGFFCFEGRLSELVYWVKRERLKNYKLYPVKGKRRKWRRF